MRRFKNRPQGKISGYCSKIEIISPANRICDESIFLFLPKKNRNNFSSTQPAFDRLFFLNIRKKKGDFRKLWITRINAAARLEGMSYSKLMGGLHKAGIEINRKVLADLAMNHPEAFKAVVEKAKNA